MCITRHARVHGTLSDEDHCHHPAGFPAGLLVRKGFSLTTPHALCMIPVLGGRPLTGTNYTLPNYLSFVRFYILNFESFGIVRVIISF